MVVKMRWLVEQLEGIKAELMEIYGECKLDRVYCAIDDINYTLGDIEREYYIPPVSTEEKFNEWLFKMEKKDQI